jgi:hypothetical protein
MLNSHGDCVTYTLPQSPLNRGWKLLMNTDNLDDPFEEKFLDGTLDVAGRSVVLLRELTTQEAGLPEISEEEVKRAVEAQVAELQPVPTPVWSSRSDPELELDHEPIAEADDAEVTEPIAAE